MLKRISFTSITESTLFFYFVLIINVLFVCSTRFYPSIDGPAHLYNANMLNSLLSGNNTVNDFYIINKMPIPNWTSEFILSFSHLFLLGFLSEKVFLIVYIVGMAIGFRYLVKVLNPKNISLSIIIFPFIYSFLFHLGFYNFSISFVIFFFSLGFGIKTLSNKSIGNYIILVVLISLLYFSNILMLFFLGLTLGLYCIYLMYEYYIENKDFKKVITFGGSKLLVVFLCTLPSLICLLIFYKNVVFFPSNVRIPTKELVQWLNDGRALIVFDYVGEQLITNQFIHILILLLVISFLGIKKTNYFSFRKIDVLVIPLIVSLILFFIIPDGASATMMSQRYCYIFTIFLLIWSITRAIPGKYNSVVIIIVLLLHLGLLFKHRNGTIKGINKDAISYYKTSECIEKNSIVLPVNVSDNWIEIHFSNYLGIDKPMIILENYEASVGWFPLKWNWEKMPNVCIANKSSLSEVQWPTNPNSPNKRQVNYIVVSGSLDKLNDQKWKELKDIISVYFKVKYISDDGNVTLFKSILVK